ncbi:MAG: exonuclease V subunit alpha, partial [Firmicutes bacterium]|nr:exonuclease V subunit alpha [Bacillota bacterium]
LEFKKDDPVLFNDSHRFKDLYNNLNGRIVKISETKESLYFEIKVSLSLEVGKSEDGLNILFNDDGVSIIAFEVAKKDPYHSDKDDDKSNDTKYDLPFQIAYAVSIHKLQGLEYESVKIMIGDDAEEMITHNIFLYSDNQSQKASNNLLVT